MIYSKIIDGDYVYGICKGAAGTNSITFDEYQHLAELFSKKPDAPDGYMYRLRASDLAWELVELSPEPPDLDPEVSDAEALEILMGGAGE